MHTNYVRQLYQIIKSPITLKYKLYSFLSCVIQL